MSKVIEVTAQTHFPIKLTASNFPVWRKQVMATLIGLGIDNYVDGSEEPPSKTLPTDATKPNPAYRSWYRQDQILLGALLGSCSETIQSVISSTETSHQAFKRLSDSYASVSRSRIISLKSRLANNPKGSRSIAEFLHEMKSIADELALAQSPVEEEDLVVHILGQLGDDFKHISAALKVRDTTMTFPDLFDKLVDHERTLTDSQSTSVLTTVNNTQKQQVCFPSRSNNDNRYSTNTGYANRSNNFGSRSNRVPDTSHNNNFNGNKFGSRGNRNTTYYQYCHIAGHTTKECRKLARFLKENHITLSMTNQTNPVVNTSTTGSTASTSPWMFDSGASHHVASNLASFHTLSEYGGADEIVLGNGSPHGGVSHAGGEDP